MLNLFSAAVTKNNVLMSIIYIWTNFFVSMKSLILKLHLYNRNNVEVLIFASVNYRKIGDFSPFINRSTSIRQVAKSFTRDKKFFSQDYYASVSY